MELLASFIKAGITIYEDPSGNGNVCVKYLVKSEVKETVEIKETTSEFSITCGHGDTDCSLILSNGKQSKEFLINDDEGSPWRICGKYKDNPNSEEAKAELSFLMATDTLAEESKNWDYLAENLDPDKVIPTHTEAAFPNYIEAINFAKELIGYKEPELQAQEVVETKEEPKPLVKCMVNLGCYINGGLHIVSLGTLEAESREEALRIAEETANIYFDKHPDIKAKVKDAEALGLKRHEIQLRPIM